MFFFSWLMQITCSSTEFSCNFRCCGQFKLLPASVTFFMCHSSENKQYAKNMLYFNVKTSYSKGVELRQLINKSIYISYICGFSTVFYLGSSQLTIPFYSYSDAHLSWYIKVFGHLTKLMWRIKSVLLYQKIAYDDKIRCWVVEFKTFHFHKYTHSVQMHTHFKHTSTNVSLKTISKWCSSLVSGCATDSLIRHKVSGYS